MSHERLVHLPTSHGPRRGQGLVVALCSQILSTNHHLMATMTSHRFELPCSQCLTPRQDEECALTPMKPPACIIWAWNAAWTLLVPQHWSKRGGKDCATTYYAVFLSDSSSQTVGMGSTQWVMTQILVFCRTDRLD